MASVQAKALEQMIRGNMSSEIRIASLYQRIGHRE